MKNVKNENIYLVVCISFVMVLLMVSYFTIRSTYAAFGNVTGVLTGAYKITYLSNWPDTSLENEEKIELKKYDYMILDNMFSIPEGYEFFGWNTKGDGTGENYSSNDVIDLTADIELYAQWVLITDDVEVIVYGDVNQDGEITNDDYLLILSYIDGADSLTEQGLINGDVNNDGKVDLVDADIIKHVCLGTEGYIGYLPNNPILIYEIYKENIENDAGNGNNNTSSGSGIGNSSGNGTGASSGGNTTGGNNSNNVQNNGANQWSGNVLSNDGNTGVDISRPTIYEFKFMYESMEYANLTCDILEDGSCMLPIPSSNPVKTGYVFNGWSLGKDCYGEIITESVIVNNDGIYYACFKESVDADDNDKDSLNTIIVVVALWVLAISIICHLIHRFNKKEKSS